MNKTCTRAGSAPTTIHHVSLDLHLPRVNQQDLPTEANAHLLFALVGGAVARVSEDWQPRQTSATLLPSRCKTVPYVSCL